MMDVTLPQPHKKDTKRKVCVFFLQRVAFAVLNKKHMKGEELSEPRKQPSYFPLNPG